MQFALNITAATSFILCKVTVKWTYCEHRTACSAKVCSGQCALDSKGGCQVGSLLLLCHYSSFLSTFPNSTSTQILYFKGTLSEMHTCGVGRGETISRFHVPAIKASDAEENLLLSRAGDTTSERITKSYEIRCIHLSTVLCKGRKIWI